MLRHPMYGEFATCSECKFHRNYTREMKSVFRTKGPPWQETCATALPGGRKMIWLVQNATGRFGVGCDVCRRYGVGSQANSFATLTVSSVAMMNSTLFARHAKDNHHKKAFEAMEADEIGLDKLPTFVDNAKPGIMATRLSLLGVPRPEKWVWAATASSSDSSGNDFQSFCDVNALGSSLPRGASSPPPLSHRYVVSTSSGPLGVTNRVGA